MKKNCYHCKNLECEIDGDYGEYIYNVCNKREDDGKNNLDEIYQKQAT